jgi:hypothetical protein
LGNAVSSRKALLSRQARSSRPLLAVPGIVALMLASLIPPIFLLIHSIGRRDGAGGIVAAACAVLYLLMLSRLWDVASSQRRGLISERALRMAGASLAVAGSVEEVASAVQFAVTALVGPSSGAGAVLAVREDGRLTAVTPAFAMAADQAWPGPARPGDGQPAVPQWARGRTAARS